MQEHILEQDDEEKKENNNAGPMDAKNDADKKEEAEAGLENAKTIKSRKMLSSCTAVEPWLLERFPLDFKDVVISHVVHKSSMLPHFQIRLTSGGSHDGKTLAFPCVKTFYFPY